MRRIVVPVASARVVYRWIGRFAAQPEARRILHAIRSAQCVGAMIEIEISEADAAVARSFGILAPLGQGKCFLPFAPPDKDTRGEVLEDVYVGP